MKSRLGVEFRLSRARETHWKEVLMRFAFGGAITAAAGFISDTFGPSVGGLFLAFPAILPAGLTLIEQHTSGSGEAATSARGAAYGAAGLVLFGLLVWSFGLDLPAWLILAIATLAWLVAAVSLWRLCDARWRNRR